MKYKSIAIAILILCVSVAMTVLAQTGGEEIGGAGTAGFLARFTGAHQVGNSTVFQTPDGSIGIGTTFPTATFNVEENGTNTFVIRGTARRTSGFANGVVGETSSPDGLGVQGVNTASSGVAVRGDVASGAAIGVFGLNLDRDATSGGGGVEGLIYGTSGFNFAIRGTAAGLTGPSVAVFGEQSSPDGSAGQFINRARGNILVGSVGPVNQPVDVFRVDGTGRVFADGGFQPNGADFAETMVVTGDRAKYEAADLLVIDPTASRRLALAQQPYSILVAGIYSTKPGFLGTTRKVDESAPKNEVPLAVVGIVPCKVTAENGAIKVGDLLVTSSTPGHAMKGTDRSKMLGAVVGKALEPLSKGTGVIQVLVTLQ